MVSFGFFFAFSLYISFANASFFVVSKHKKMKKASVRDCVYIYWTLPKGDGLGNEFEFAFQMKLRLS